MQVAQRRAHGVGERGLGERRRLQHLRRRRPGLAGQLAARREPHEVQEGQPPAVPAVDGDVPGVAQDRQPEVLHERPPERLVGGGDHPPGVRFVSHSMIDVTEQTSTMFASCGGPGRAPAHRATWPSPRAAAGHAVPPPPAPPPPPDRRARRVGDAHLQGPPLDPDVGARHVEAFGLRGEPPRRERALAGAPVLRDQLGDLGVVGGAAGLDRQHALVAQLPELGGQRGVPGQQEQLGGVAERRGGAPGAQPADRVGPDRAVQRPVGLRVALGELGVEQVAHQVVQVQAGAGCRTNGRDASHAHTSGARSPTVSASRSSVVR